MVNIMREFCFVVLSITVGVLALLGAIRVAASQGAAPPIYPRPPIGEVWCAQFTSESAVRYWPTDREGKCR
jgi:hypothetical protein